MKRLLIPFLEKVDYRSSVDELLAASDTLEANDLAEVSWPAFPYRPFVRFKVGHTADSLLLAYTVREAHVRAEYRNTNDPVYQDSCVEFFLSFDGVNYYNLEFNCLGVGLIGYGDADKQKRRRLPKETVELVRAWPSIKPKAPEAADTEWSLLLSIPFTVFDAHAIDSMAGMRCRGNFYKCGDNLPVPHFVSWNRIDYPEPNFHLPQFFGELWFE